MRNDGAIAGRVRRIPVTPFLSAALAASRVTPAGRMAPCRIVPYIRSRTEESFQIFFVFSVFCSEAIPMAHGFTRRMLASSFSIHGRSVTTPTESFPQPGDFLLE